MDPLINRASYLVAIVTFIISLLVGWSRTYEFFPSLTMAAISAAMVWGAYIVLRMIKMAMRR